MEPSAFGKKIKELYPQYSGVDDAQLGQKFIQKYGASVGGIQSGQLTIKDIPEAQRGAVSLGLQAIEYQPEEKKNSIETKKSDAFNASVNLINELEQKFSSAKGGEFTGLGAIIAGTKKNIAGSLNLDKGARVYNRTREGFTAALKDLTGDVGVLTDRDYERIANLLPKFTDDPEVAKELFGTLRSQMAAKYGGEKTQTGYQQPEVKGGALAALFPATAGLLKQKQEEVQQQGMGAIPKQSLETALPILNLLRPEGVNTAAEISSTFGLTSLLKGGAGKLKGLTKLGALENRAKIAAGTAQKISGKNVYEKAEEKVLKSISETDRPQALKLLERAKEGLSGKEFDAPTALEKLAQYNKAYTTSGAAGKSAKAAVNDALSKAMRSELPKDLQIAQGQLAQALGLGKNIRKGISYASLGAGGIAATGYLLNLLRGKGRQ